MINATPLALPLLPLNVVLWPDEKCTLNALDARFTPLIKACIKTQAPLGVVAVLEAPSHTATSPAAHLALTGTLASITTTPASTESVLSIECVGTQRFHYTQCTHTAGGLWIAKDAQLMPSDLPVEIPASLQRCSDLLQKLVTALILSGQSAFEGSLLFANAGWVANRWAQLLPLSVAQRLALLEIHAPVERLEAVARHISQAKLF